MPLAEILRAMESEAIGEREAIAAEAAAAAERVLVEARAAAAAQRQLRLAAELRAVRPEQARRRNEARLAGLREVGAARDEVLAAIFAEAAARLRRLRAGPDYPEICRRLLAEAAAAVGPGPLLLRVDPTDAGLAASLTAELGLTATIRTSLSCAGGLDVSDEAARVAIHNTFEARLDRAREVLREEIRAAVEAGRADREPAGAGA